MIMKLIKRIKENVKNRLKFGIIISITLFLLFALMQYFDSIVLNLEAQWIAVALLPIIISLLYEGRLTEFKALGIELKVEPSQVDISHPENKIKSTVDKDSKSFPSDYFYLNHTSFFRADKQLELQKKTGLIDVPLFDIRVKLFSYYVGAIENVQKIQYYLHNSYDTPVRESYNRESNFELKELAFGEYVLTAKVFLKDIQEPFIVQRYITLWESGPEI